jgi:hypothetical protein
MHIVANARERCQRGYETLRALIDGDVKEVV